jgi:hypothetical protein
MYFLFLYDPLTSSPLYPNILFSNLFVTKLFNKKMEMNGENKRVNGLVI